MPRPNETTPPPWPTRPALVRSRLQLPASPETTLRAPVPRPTKGSRRRRAAGTRRLREGRAERRLHTARRRPLHPGSPTPAGSRRPAAGSREPENSDNSGTPTGSPGRFSHPGSRCKRRHRGPPDRPARTLRRLRRPEPTPTFRTLRPASAAGATRTRPTRSKDGPRPGPPSRCGTHRPLH